MITKAGLIILNETAGQRELHEEFQLLGSVESHTPNGRAMTTTNVLPFLHEAGLF